MKTFLNFAMAAGIAVAAMSPMEASAAYRTIKVFAGKKCDYYGHCRNIYVYKKVYYEPRVYNKYHKHHKKQYNSY